MSTQNSLLNKFMLAFKAEGLKLKRRKMIKLSYLIPLSGIVFLGFGLSFADKFKMLFADSGAIKFEDMLDIYMGFFMYAIFPIMIAVYTASISSIEREAKTGFTLGVLPTSPFLVFLTKILKNFINTVLGVFVGLVSVMIFAVIANNSLQWYPTEYDYMHFLELIGYGQLGSLMFIPIIILHTWLGERFNIKLLNMFGMMFIGFVTTLIVTKTQSYLYIPHTLPVELMHSYFDPDSNFAVSVITYILWTGGLLYLVFLDLNKNIFRRKK